MSSTSLLERLFTAHQNDLHEVAPETKVGFLCPICLRDFERSSIYNRVLTEGHVWPKELRDETDSKPASSQRVLLCNTCNNTAGGRGDGQMQILHQVRKAEKTGKLYGERRVQLLIPGEEPIELHASIVNTGEKSGRLVFDVDAKTGKWLRNNPAAEARFKKMGPDDRFSVLIHPPHDLKTHLAPSGWVTSAYLLAFYAFGYRYALSVLLDPVRDYILSNSKSKGCKG